MGNLSKWDSNPAPQSSLSLFRSALYRSVYVHTPFLAGLAGGLSLFSGCAIRWVGIIGRRRRLLLLRCIGLGGINARLGFAQDGCDVVDQVLPKEEVSVSLVVRQGFIQDPPLFALGYPNSLG